MPRQSPNFIAITCTECHAIIMLVTPGAIVYATKIRCSLCSKVRTILPVDNIAAKEYTLSQPA